MKVEDSEWEDEVNLVVGQGEDLTSEDTDGDDGENDDEDVGALLADILAVNDAGWKFRQPKVPAFHVLYIDANAVGSIKAKTVKFDVDFNSRESVDKAKNAPVLNSTVRRSATASSAHARPPSASRQPSSRPNKACRAN